jgi:predicted nucleic acid-binding protein
LIVVDASVLANALADDEDSGRLARDRLAGAGDLVAPDLVDVETVSVLRRRWLAHDLSARRFSAAVDDLEALALTRFPTLPLMLRAYELRAKVTPYEAAYVALAEQLDCPLVTADRRLAESPGVRCAVDLVSLPLTG